MKRPLRSAAIGLASLVGGEALAQEPAPQPAADAPAAEAAAAPAHPAAPAEPSAEERFVLPPVEVQGEAEKYKVEESSLGRLAAPLRDTPQQVVVVPEKVMAEQGATTVREALRNVSGITISAGEGGRQGDTFVLRGFSAQADVYRDGVRDLGWFTRETFNLSGVETFFGPSAVLFGRGSTGGAINLVTRKPLREVFQELRLTGGTAPSGRVELDVNQPVGERAEVRVTAVGQLASVSGRDEVEENRAAVAPAARVTLGDKTSLELDYLYQRERSVPDYGQPFLNGRPISAGGGVGRDVFYGVKGADTEQVDAHIATARLLHTLRDGWVLTNTLRYGQVYRFARPTAPTGPTPAASPTAVGRQRFETQTNNRYLINQTDVRAAFTTWLLEHSVNAGMELARETRDQHRDNLQVPGPGGPNLQADVFNPDPTPDLSAVARVFNSASATDQTTFAAYAADQVKLTRYLELLASLRFDLFRTDFQTESATVALRNVSMTDRLFNWRGGLVFHPLETISIYGMAGTSANPSAELGTLANGAESLAPERTRSLELGAKADLLGGRLGLGGAAFRIDKTDARVPNTDPAGPPQILDGRQRVEGLSLGLSGNVLGRWRAFLSYTLLRSEILEHTNPFLIGQSLPNVPLHSASLWTTYELLDDLTVGGGVAYQSETVVNNPADANAALNRVPRFWRFDAFARYAFGVSEIQLNLNNLSNALYYEQLSPNRAVPAEALSANLALKVRF